MTKEFNNDSKVQMEISEVMTSTVHTISPSETVEAAAKMMLDNKVGSIIILSKNDNPKPLGIVTERDIVTRVVAIGKDSSKIPVDEIATRPVVTAPPTLDVAEAMSLMARLNIRRLIVVEGNNVSGICTYRDLLRVAPSLIEVALEYEKIGFRNRQDPDEIDTVYEDYDKDSELSHHDLTLGYYCTMCGDRFDDTPLGDDDQPLCSDCYASQEN